MNSTIYVIGPWVYDLLDSYRREEGVPYVDQFISDRMVQEIVRSVVASLNITERR